MFTRRGPIWLLCESKLDRIFRQFDTINNPIQKLGTRRWQHWGISVQRSSGDASVSVLRK